ncbi:MAG: HAMP domain-containing histidine kinase [Lachnospiraceae bacterium]|nr:HAMP domain-containing histidine kinase [Lachnospiraceae bacterium]
MEKMRERKWRRRKKKIRSLRQTLFFGIFICAFLAFLGSMAIGFGTNYLQNWYSSSYMEGEDTRIWKDGYEIIIDQSGNLHYSYVGEEVPTYDKRQINLTKELTFDIISYAQTVLIPLWILACVWSIVWIFYKRELEKPLRVLQDASEKIADNCLDFELEPVKDNELGRLRDGFEKMRAALYENNRAMWQQVEERKRLNAAFAHDMRTPITVLKGYGEMLERYIPEGRISQDKLMEILGMMNGQIRRLENYTQKMSSIRKLEDLEPEVAPVKAAALDEKLRSMCEILGQEILYSFSGEGILGLDETLVLEVCENLISNGLRYARQRLQVTVRVAEGELSGSEEESERYLEITVEDDGPGFSPEDLQHATDPFYRGEGQMEQSHFGLGLYICRLICGKCGGSLILSNAVCGGRVTARFKIVSEDKQ